jgi:hypothetical protein
MTHYKIEIEFWGSIDFPLSVLANSEKEAEQKAMEQFWEQAECRIDVVDEFTTDYRDDVPGIKVEISLWGCSPFPMTIQADSEEEAKRQAKIYFWDEVDCTIGVVDEFQTEPSPDLNVKIRAWTAESRELTKTYFKQ